MANITVNGLGLFVCKQMFLQPILCSKPAQTNIAADGFDRQLAGSAPLVEHKADDVGEVGVAAGTVTPFWGNCDTSTFAAI